MRHGKTRTRGAQRNEEWPVVSTSATLFSVPSGRWAQGKPSFQRGRVGREYAQRLPWFDPSVSSNHRVMSKRRDAAVMTGVGGEISILAERIDALIPCISWGQYGTEMGSSVSEAVGLIGCS